MPIQPIDLQYSSCTAGAATASGYAAAGRLHSPIQALWPSHSHEEDVCNAVWYCCTQHHPVIMPGLCAQGPMPLPEGGQQLPRWQSVIDQEQREQTNWCMCSHLVQYESKAAST
jgi:hypothetical protein